MSNKTSTSSPFAERLLPFILILFFLLGLGLLEFKRQRPSFTLQVLSETPPFPVSSPKISLNSATMEALTRLPGVGPHLAQRIVEYRNQHGPFTTLEELRKVKGIGPHLLKRIDSYLSLE